MERDEREDEKPCGEDRGRQAVEKETSGASLSLRAWSPPEERTAPAGEALERAPAEVRDLGEVPQQVVAVELEERIDVEEDSHPAHAEHDPGEVVEEGVLRGDAPGEDRERPEEELDLPPCEGHPEPHFASLSRGVTKVCFRWEGWKEGTGGGSGPPASLAGRSAGVEVDR